MWILLDHFHGIYDSRKTLLDYTNLFSPDDYQKNDKIYISTLKTNMAKENEILDFRLKDK